MGDHEDLPFERSVVSKAIQRFSKLTKRTQETAVAMDTSLSMSYSSAFGSGSRRMCFTIRSFIEPGRCVFVLDTVIDFVTGSKHATPWLVLRERKWTILTDIAFSSPATALGPPRSSSCSDTRVQTVASIAPAASSSCLNLPTEWNRRSLVRSDPRVRVIPKSQFEWERRQRQLAFARQRCLFINGPTHRTSADER